MSFEVEFITLGDASKELNVPSPTLRHWADKLEEFEVHYVKRNNRNERIYYSNDIEVFKFLKDLKNEYGRKTTTKDLAYMIAEKGKNGEFKLRTKEDAPEPKPSNRTADLLNQEDIQRLMQSERVKQFIGIVIDETTKNMKEELVEEIRETVREEIRMEIASSLDKKTAKMEEIANKMEEGIRKRDEQTLKYFEELDRRRAEDAKKGFFAKLLRK